MTRPTQAIKAFLPWLTEVKEWDPTLFCGSLPALSPLLRSKTPSIPKSSLLQRHHDTYWYIQWQHYKSCTSMCLFSLTAHSTESKSCLCVTHGRAEALRVKIASLWPHSKPMARKDKEAKAAAARYCSNHQHLSVTTASHHWQQAEGPYPNRPPGSFAPICELH